MLHECAYAVFLRGGKVEGSFLELSSPGLLILLLRNLYP